MQLQSIGKNVCTIPPTALHILAVSYSSFENGDSCKIFNCLGSRPEKINLLGLAPSQTISACPVQRIISRLLSKKCSCTSLIGPFLRELSSHWFIRIVHCLTVWLNTYCRCDIFNHIVLI